MKHIFTTSTLFLIVISTAFAQSPGGVSGAGTNQMWLNADQLGLSNNDRVSNWTDMSGLGNSATATSSARPTFKTNQFNGRSAIQFDGSDDVMRTGSIAALNTNKITSFAVFSSTATTTGLVYRYAWSTGAGGNSNYIYGHVNVPTSNSLKYQSKNGNSANIEFSKTPYTGTSCLTTQKWNGTSSFLGNFNGALVSNVVGSNVNPGGNLGVSLGANYSANPYYLKMLMAEKISYSKALSSAEINIVENYLAAKYNITIANDMYAYQATASYDVIGLGKEADGSNLSAKGISPLGLSVGSLSNGDYLFAGHNNAGYSPNIADVPLAGYSRFNQVWRADKTGAPGTITVTFDVSTYGLGQTNTYQLLVDGDGTFSTTDTQYPGVYSLGTVTFSNVDLPAGSYFTLANSNGIINSTNLTTDWHTTTTWDCGCIPVAGMFVNVLAGHTVDINGQNAASATLTVDGTLTFSSTDTLAILQDLINNGTLTAGNGTVLLNGTTVQTLTGTLALNNLTINNAAGVTNTSALSIAGGGYLNVKSGSLATGDNLTLLSASSGTGALANPATGTITGTLKVQRYLSERWSGGTFGNSWFLLSPMVIGGTIEDWNQEFEMQGFPGTEWPVTSSSVYYYNQANIVSNFNDGYTVPTNTSNVMPNSRGYEAYVGDDSYFTGPRTIDISGTAYLGAQAISAPHTVKLGDPANDGWTLMANPYASPVLWGNVQKSGAFDNAYRRMWNGTDALLANGYTLGVGEAFWVHADPGGATITFDPTDVPAVNIDRYNDRISSVSEEPVLAIQLIYGENQFDETEVGFSANAIDERERGVDAYKLKNRATYKPNISTMIGNSDFCRNILNNNTNSIVPIRIYTDNPSLTIKEYSLVISNVKNIVDYNKELILEDRTLNTFTEIVEDTKVDFEMADDNKEARFFLHVKTPIQFTTEQTVCSGKSSGKAVASINKAGSYNFVWKNETGEVVKSSKNTTSSSCTNLPAGNYTLEVNDYRQKFTITELDEVKADFTASIGGVDYGQIVSTNDDNVLQVKSGEVVTFEALGNNQISNSWDFGDRSSSELANTSHIYFEEGIYNVVLTSKNGDCSTTTTKTIQVTNSSLFTETNLFDEVNVIVKGNDIFVYMNNLENNGNVKFEVVNALGQVVYSSSKVVNSNHTEIIHLDKSAGLFFLNLEGFNQTKTKKIVLN